MVCSIIRSCLTQDIKYHVLYETSARKIWEILEKKYLTHLKRRLYRFQLKGALSIGNTCTIANLINVDIEIDEEDKTVILLNSLPDKEYKTFVLTLINGKQTLDYSDVSAALVNYEVRKKNKHSSSKSDSAEALMI